MAEPLTQSQRIQTFLNNNKIRSLIDNVTAEQRHQTGADAPPDTTRVQASSRMARARFDPRANLTELSAWLGR